MSKWYINLLKQRNRLYDHNNESGMHESIKLEEFKKSIHSLLHTV